MGIRRVTSSSPCLILAMRVERSLLKSASGANKCISGLDRMSTPLIFLSSLARKEAIVMAFAYKLSCQAMQILGGRQISL
eukprot:771463-Pelagomonas_calceolata.AAC.1